MAARKRQRKINENIEATEKAEDAEIVEASEAEMKAYAEKVAKRRIAPDFWDF